MNTFSSEKLRKHLPHFKTILEENIYPLEKDYLVLPFSKVETELNKIRELVKQNGWWNQHLSESHGGMGFH